MHYAVINVHSTSKGIGSRSNYGIGMQLKYWDSWCYPDPFRR